MDGWMDKLMVEQVDKWMDDLMDVWIDELMVQGWTNGRMDGLMNG